MILVAGGTGFVGGGIVRELARRGKPVAVLTRSAAKATTRFPDIEVEYREGDVRDPASLAAAVQGAEVVIGCVQFPNSPIENQRRGHTFEETDAAGTERLVEASKAAGVQRYIYVSGAGAAADAKYHWFRAKWRAETAVRDSGITYVIFRPSWVYGPEDHSLNRFLTMSRFLPFVPIIGVGSRQRLQPVFIDDLGWAVAEAVDNRAADNRVLEIGGPEVLTMKEIVRTGLEVLNRRRFILPIPKVLMKAQSALLQFLPRPPLTPDAVDFITMDALADNSELVETLGLRLTPLRESLATYLVL
ncbi:MAG: complex I NDUFA9 subunit family protein [Dehalococcoidia bacterium]|nr:MAG: complex I NDUFA9 subunit family protein [Dehalococcoidia bacterium]